MALLLVFVVIVIVSAAVTFALLSVRRYRRQDDQAVLQIRPPRPYVDADGRSDYRPELRARVQAYRSREGR